MSSRAQRGIPELVATCPQVQASVDASSRSLAALGMTATTLAMTSLPAAATTPLAPPAPPAHESPWRVPPKTLLLVSVTPSIDQPNQTVPDQLLSVPPLGPCNPGHRDSDLCPEPGRRPCCHSRLSLRRHRTMGVERVAGHAQQFALDLIGKGDDALDKDVRRSRNAVIRPPRSPPVHDLGHREPAACPTQLLEHDCSQVGVTFTVTSFADASAQLVEILGRSCASVPAAARCLQGGEPEIDSRDARQVCQREWCESASSRSPIRSPSVDSGTHCGAQRGGTDRGADRSAGEAREHLVLHQHSHFERHAREHDHRAARRVEPEPGRRSPLIGQRDATDRHHRLRTISTPRAPDRTACIARAPPATPHRRTGAACPAAPPPHSSTCRHALGRDRRW